MGFAKLKIKIESLGCRLNQSEIESISTTLQNMGHSIVFEGDADIYIINSCAVTLRSERKTRQLIYRAMDQIEKNSGKGQIIVTGCATDSVKQINDIIYVSNDHKYLIPDIITKRTKISASAPARFNFEAAVKSSINRINLKIQDGCDNFCSYCIIPYTRGKPQSRSDCDILDEFKTLLDNGYKEIILTGVNIGKYNYEGCTLGHLTEKILNLNGNFRLHLTSLDPECADDRLISLFGHEKMVKHLHLSLQSGSDSVLKRMNRPYDRNLYISVTEKLKKIDRDFNFTTDLIVGFPGESDEEFADSISLIKEVGFSHIHTFRYSPRPGTAAASFPDSIAENIKSERSKEIINIYMKQKEHFYKRFCGRDGILLSEKFNGKATTGFTEYYIPVEIEGYLKKNEFYKIKITTCEKYKLTARVYED